MTINDISNTEYVQRDLLKRYEEILETTAIEITLSPSNEIFLYLTENDKKIDIQLNKNQLKVLKKTVAPISMSSILEELSYITPSVIQQVIKEFDEIGLIYINKNRIVNTLPSKA